MQEETRDNKGTSSNLDNGLQISSHGSKPDVNHRQEGSIFLLSPSLVLSVLGGVLRAEGNVKHLGRWMRACTSANGLGAGPELLQAMVGGA